MVAEAPDPIDGPPDPSTDLDIGSVGDAGAEVDVGDDAVVDLDGTARPLLLPPARPNGSILMAAMLGLANALGMEPRNEPTEMVQPADPLDDDLRLDFGSLPPLN